MKTILLDTSIDYTSWDISETVSVEMTEENLNMSDDLVKRLRWLGDHASFEPHMHHTAADRIEKLEAALREIAQTVTVVDEDWHPSYHDFSFTQKQAEGAYEELGRRILIARKALEGKDD